MSMPPGPDPTDQHDLVQTRLRLRGDLLRLRDQMVDAGIALRELGNQDFGPKLDALGLPPEALEALKMGFNAADIKLSGNEDKLSGSEEKTFELVPTIHAAWSVTRLRAPGVALRPGVRRVLLAAGIVTFDLWDHDGHAGSAVLTDLVDLWTANPGDGGATGRRNRWEMIKLLRLAGRQLDGNSFTTTEISDLPLDSYRRVAKGGRLSHVFIEAGISSVLENPDHIDYDWFGPGTGLGQVSHWWPITKASSVGESLERKILRGIQGFLERSLGIQSSANFADFTAPFELGTTWVETISIAYNGQSAPGGFDSLRLNWGGTSWTESIAEPVYFIAEGGQHVLSLKTPVPTSNDLNGAAPVFNDLPA